MGPAAETLRVLLHSFTPGSARERRDVGRVEDLLGTPDPWDRSCPLHCTGSAIVAHPGSGQVLLRWHERQQRWLQVGGHAEVGDATPFAVAAREAAEETGLTDLTPWPDAERPTLLQVAVVPVPAGKGEPAHEHADLRFLLATSDPSTAAPESHGAPLRWLPVADAIDEVVEDNVVQCLRRVASLLDEC
ncbi:MAG TPA: NUDIX domain-containing protein [Acidimicrobiia bacterium]